MRRKKYQRCLENIARLERELGIVPDPRPFLEAHKANFTQILLYGYPR